MNEKKLTFSVGSDSDFENLIADVGYNNNLVFLLTQEEGFENLRIRIYPPKDLEYWEFPLGEFEEIINAAKKRLWELRKIPDL